MKRRWLVVPAAFALALVVAGLGAAHVPSVSAGCVAGLPVGTVTLTSYPPGSTVTVNGATVTFGALVHGQPAGGYSHTYQLGSPTVAHTFHVVVVSPDGIGNLDETETTPVCTGAEATSTTTTNPTPTTTPTASVPPSSPTGPNSTTSTTSSTVAPSESSVVGVATPPVPPPSSAPDDSSPGTSPTLAARSNGPSTPTNSHGLSAATEGLPATGVDVHDTLWGAGVVLVAGLGLLVVTRRRRA